MVSCLNTSATTTCVQVCVNPSGIPCQNFLYRAHPIHQVPEALTH
jgi:hypothetical protein